MEIQFEPLTLPELFQKAKREVYQELDRQKTKEKTTRPENAHANIPDCLSYILTAKPKTDNTNFNKLILNLVTGFQRTGYDYQVALDIALSFLTEYPHSTAYPTPKDRTEHFRTQWGYVEKNQNYDFSCSYILGLRFPGSAFDCKKCGWCKEEKQDDSATIPPKEEKPVEEEELKKVSFTSEEILDALNANEDGDAQLFIKLYQGKFCYDHAACRWNRFTGHYWVEDRIDQATAGIKKIIAVYHEEAKKQAWLRLKCEKKRKNQDVNHHKTIESDLVKRIRALQSSQRKANVLHLAKVGEGSLGISGDEWDKEFMLLGCLNGVINLEDASFRPGRPEDFIKTIAPVEWQGLRIHTPKWGKFLAEIFNSDWDLILYMKRLLGYAITGKTTDHIYPIFHGDGRNGKGTLLETLKCVLGELADPLEAEMMLQQTYVKQSGSPSSDIISLRGKRLTWASESGENRRLNTERLKWLTGGDTLTGRPPYGRLKITFSATHKMFLLTNHKPQAPANDFSLWNRIHLIPFDQCFLSKPDGSKNSQHKADPDLKEKLKKEASGILAWLVDGCLRWQKGGLNPPEKVLAATKEYQEEEDLIAQFIEQRCELSQDFEQQAGPLYKEYHDWCLRNQLTSMTGTSFGKDMKNRFGSHKDRKTKCIFYEGIKLLPEGV